ncbi:MAG TPA: hypothetical protein VN281_16385 [Verrucomicrobiae bacterium]|nr:hypothetical protein [Verrucomicrobiae bacterium]
MPKLSALGYECVRENLRATLTQVPFTPGRPKSRQLAPRKTSLDAGNGVMARHGVAPNQPQHPAEKQSGSGTPWFARGKNPRSARSQPEHLGEFRSRKVMQEKICHNHICWFP